MNLVWNVWHPQQTSYLPFYQGSSSTSARILLSTLLHFWKAHHSSLSTTSSLPGAHQPAPAWASLCLYAILPFSLAGELTSVTLCLAPWPQHCLCWHPKWRTGFLSFTAWAEPLISSIFTSAFPVQDIADEGLGIAKDLLNVFVILIFLGKKSILLREGYIYIYKTAIAWSRKILTFQNNN